MPKESLRISHGELSGPPWPAPQMCRVNIPLPKGWEKELQLPAEALDAQTGKLICFYEADWASIAPGERKRLFPRPDSVRIQLPMEFFSHQLMSLDLSDVYAVLEFVSEWGVVLAPILSSKKRFIACRLHNAKEGCLYSALFPASSRSRNEEKRFLEEALFSIKVAWSAEHGDLFPSLVPAVTASEYARRSFCSFKGAASGGIVSYIEVAQTISLLRNSVRLVIASDAARGSASQIYQEIIELDDCKPLEGILDDEKRSLEERKRLFFNAFEFELDDALHFTSLSLSSSGTLDVWHSIRHANKEAGLKYHFIDFSPTPLDIEAVWSQINPRYVDDPFYEGSLLEAICAQLVNTCNDTESWKRCGNKSCGRWFKYKQPSAASDNKQERKRAGIYCSDKCSNDWRNHQYSVENKIISDGVKAGHDDGRIIAKLEMTSEFYDVIPRGIPATPKQAAERKKAETEYQRVRARWQKKIEQTRKKQG